MARKSILVGGSASRRESVDQAIKRADDNFAELYDKQNVATGAAKTAGNATLVGGTVNIATSLAVAGQLVKVNHHTPGGTLGHLSYVCATGTLTINSSSGTDTSVVTWELVR